MTDELTPEEREALKNLPRERMPSAGLEDRVVGAMRERGILAARPPRRVVRITTGRIAGLLAASFALMIGAYSIGLHRGGDNEVIRSVQPQTPAVLDETIRQARPEIQESEPAAGLEKSDAPAAGRETHDAPATSSTPAELPRMAEPKKEAREEKSGLDWSLKDTDVGREDDASVEAPAAAVPPSSKGRSNELRQSQVQPPASSSASRILSFKSPVESAAPPPLRERSFMLGDTALFVEAPDSVRIIEDAEGRMLLIYTSDGLIRIRLAD